MITYNFHVRKICRAKYQINKDLFTVTGNLIITNLQQARLLAQKINLKRSEEPASVKIYPGLLNGVGLLHEIFHFLIRHYETKENPGVFKRLLAHLHQNMGDSETDRLLLEFVNDFPPLHVYEEKLSASEFLSGNTEEKSNREIILEELILLSLQNINPAALPIQELFSDKYISANTKYGKFITECDNFFSGERPFGKSDLSMIRFLKIPIQSAPDNIEAQLDFIRENWNIYISELLVTRLLSGKDLINEDAKWFTRPFGMGTAAPPVPTYEFDKEYFEMLRRRFEAGENLSEDELSYYHSESEKFTADTDWMPKVVMMAKNASVWLYQLSLKYQRNITRLDQVPDEELNKLASWNFTALWLIGIWERSPASKKIKQFMGNPEAAASAYSLYDYVIASELGGESAFENLKNRAWQRGIRMGSDMVPNHTGIYSKWVIEKPDYFIKTDTPPYPSYTFNSSNLSDDHRVEVRIEDKYYNHSDAAVVFQRRDSYTGDTTYIYHGNDGTHMPWNDTAQLNLLNPEVRESLIQTIMHVARKTPIIRFDAAMTLAKKHFQRLWFPIPGSGSGIPSRADYAMTRSQFDEAIPEEFWREVVDRMNNEMPETLLLAEAFWLMESYFVRTLGMHRVYNSAFMHMMMKEENEKYRLLIKNTLSFNPEILKRYVNFMSNPDEETAVNQFGKGDKYFGVAVLLVTLPGLPMFGHGQVEGFAEKYGMEYKRSYYDEHIDDHLVWRHETEIFPLVKKRYLFSQANFFEFYDFLDDHGNVVENVFAFSNRSGDERALVVYNNSYAETKGTINYTVDKAVSSNEMTAYRKLGDALGINPAWKIYYIYRDHKSNMEFLVSGYDIMEHGLHFYLPGYQYHVFIDFREVYDHHGDYERLKNYLGGRGVPSIHYALEELKLTPFHDTLRHLLSSDVITELNNFYSGETKTISQRLITLLNSSLESINHYEDIHFDAGAVLDEIIQSLAEVKELKTYTMDAASGKRKPSWVKNGYHRLQLQSDLILPYIILYTLNRNTGKNLFIKTRMDIPVNEMLKDNYTPVIGIFSSGTWFKPDTKKEHNPGSIITGKFFNNPDTAEFINLHRWEGTRYYNKERLETLLNWYLTAGLLSLSLTDGKEISKGTKKKVPVTKGTTKKESSPAKKNRLSAFLKETAGMISEIQLASDESDYKADALLQKLEQTAMRKPAPAKRTAGITKDKPAVKKNTAKKTAATKKEIKSDTEKKEKTSSNKKNQKVIKPRKKKE